MMNKKLPIIDINNQFKIFTKKNLSILYISIYSIDTYNINTSLKTITKKAINTLLNIENYFNNIHYKNKLFTYNYYSLINILYLLVNIKIHQHLHKQVTYILKEILKTNNNKLIYSKITQNYFKKFHYNYIQNTNLYTTGYILYKNKTYIKLLSISSLLIIHQLYKKYNISYLLIYLVS